MKKFFEDELKKVQQFTVDVNLDPDIVHPRPPQSSSGQQGVYMDFRSDLRVQGARQPKLLVRAGLHFRKILLSGSGQQGVYMDFRSDLRVQGEERNHTEPQQWFLDCQLEEQ
ncbi:hypothetical protein INR49_007192, partial [Caranx melampygus]